MDSPQELKSTTISMDKKYVTKNGHPVRILCVDRNHECCVIALVGTEGRVRQYTKEGFVHGPNMPHLNDLVEAKW